MNRVELASFPSVAMAFAALFVGVRTAVIWKAASMIATDPDWRSGPSINGADALKPIEPIDQSQAQAGWIAAITEASAKSADTIWTAWAVVGASFLLS